MYKIKRNHKICDPLYNSTLLLSEYCMHSNLNVIINFNFSEVEIIF